VPALPNGLKDAFTQSSTSPPADERQRGRYLYSSLRSCSQIIRLVDTLLNPCTCKSLWKCKCRARSTERPLSQQPAACSGLLTLASAAAALECCSKSSSNSTQTSPTASVKRQARPRSLKSSRSTSSKRPRQEEHSCVSAHSHNLQLPPLLYISSSASTPQDLSLATMPDFDFMPPIDQIASLAGSGCTCGVQCACPSCAEHNQNGYTDTEKRNCADGCGTCIDPSLQFSLPSNAVAGSSTFPSLSHSSTSNHLGDKESFLDRFFACAAALPPPPECRKTLVHLDPMNTTVYSNKFGPPINLPKLDCCGGRCTCPGDRCPCTSSCLGCGTDKGEERLMIVTQPQEMVPVA
jgi:hypothetical protein